MAFKLLLPLALLAAALPAQAKVYKWVDAHGNVQYSDTFEEAQIAVRARYEADKQRFSELKGLPSVAAPAQNASMPVTGKSAVTPKPKP